MEGMKKRWRIIGAVCLVLIGILFVSFILLSQNANTSKDMEENELDLSSYYLGAFIGTVSIRETIFYDGGEISENEDLKYKELLDKLFTEENTRENLLSWAEYAFSIEAFSGDYEEERETIGEFGNVDALSMSKGFAVETNMTTIDMYCGMEKISESDYKEIYELYKDAVITPTQYNVDKFLENSMKLLIEVMRRVKD